MSKRDILLQNVIDKMMKSTNANIASLVPTEKEYRHLSDDKNINNKRTIDYAENIKAHKHCKSPF